MPVITVTSPPVYSIDDALESMMSKQRFVFLLKGDVATPQSLEDPDAGEIIRAALNQSFSISPIHVLAKNNHEAMAKFQLLNEGQVMGRNMEVMLY
jgi:hypothetical protein